MTPDIQFEVDGLEPEQRDALTRVNDSLHRLAARRRSQVRVEGLFAKSKLAWKLAVLEESFLHRVVALAHGVALTWNAGNLVTSILAARALMETVVLVEDFHGKIDALLKVEDLGGSISFWTVRHSRREMQSGLRSILRVRPLTF
jgi:hypothetical protein